jgi:hypothetical protein
LWLTVRFSGRILYFLIYPHSLPSLHCIHCLFVIMHQKVEIRFDHAHLTAIVLSRANYLTMCYDLWRLKIEYPFLITKALGKFKQKRKVSLTSYWKWIIFCSSPRLLAISPPSELIRIHDEYKCPQPCFRQQLILTSNF